MWHKLLIILFSIIFTVPCFAQGLPPLGISDEGGAVSRPVFVLDCSGAGVECSHSGVTGTITVSGGSGDHDAVTLAGEDYLSLATQQITALPINGDNINWDTIQDLIGDTQINWASVQGITGSNINWSLIDEDVITGINWTAYEDTNTTYTAGRSLTLDGTTINADAELYTDSISFVLESPTDDDAFILFKAPHAITITDIDCIVGAATSAVIDIQECDSAGANCATVDATITCDADGAADDGTLSNGGIDAGDWLKLDIGTVTGTVKYVSGTVTFTRND